MTGAMARRGSGEAVSVGRGRGCGGRARRLRGEQLAPYLGRRAIARFVRMAQLFRPSANQRARLSLWGLVVAVALLAGVAHALAESGWSSGRGRYGEQPLQFSHAHHVGGVGLDCRYCHQTAEVAAFAGMPTTETCMHCHAQLFADAPMLAPVRDSWATGRPIAWRRVYDLPDFTYFDHSAHLRERIGCETCHGRVDRMPLIRQTVDLSMKWCVDCHRDPAPFRRPAAAVFTMGWQPAAGPRQAHDDEEEEPHLSCSECHR